MIHVCILSQDVYTSDACAYALMYMLIHMYDPCACTLMYIHTNTYDAYVYNQQTCT